MNSPVFSATYAKQQDIIKSLDGLKSINGKLLSIDDEEKINELITSRVKILDTLMEQLKLTLVSNITSAGKVQNIKFLESRIHVNQEKRQLSCGAARQNEPGKI
jgi:hypothetical protein